MSTEQSLPLRVRNLSVGNSHCQFVADGVALKPGDERRIADGANVRRVRIVSVQDSGPSHRRRSLVLARLIDQRGSSARLQTPSPAGGKGEGR
jgi:hypothetical protein